MRCTYNTGIVSLLERGRNQAKAEKDRFVKEEIPEDNCDDDNVELTTTASPLLQVETVADSSADDIADQEEAGSGDDDEQEGSGEALVDIRTDNEPTESRGAKTIREVFNKKDEG